MRRLVYGASALVILNPAAALADDDLWFGAKVGTLGLGVEASWRPVPYLDVRAGANGFSFDQDGSEAGIEYEGEIDLQSFYATANLRVPLSPFRFTAGVFSNGNEIGLVSAQNQTIQIGDTTFTSDQVGTLSAGASFDDVAPYVGVGLDFRLLDTLGMHLDAGVLRQGSVLVAMAADGPIASDPLFQQELEKERAELQESLDDYELYPVLSLGFSFNF
jgi:hypothetical protein